MAIVVNLAGVKTTLDLIPDGTYPARLTKAAPGKSKANNDKYSLEFVFEPEAGEEIGGRKAYIDVPLTDNSLWRVKKTLIDLGMAPEEVEGPVNLEVAFDNLLGSDAIIRVGHHEYQNNTHNDFYLTSPDSWTA